MKPHLSPKVPWLALVPFVWVVVFILIPLMMIVAHGFATRGPYGVVSWDLTVENLVRVWDPLYARILWDTVVFAGLTTLICLMLGYPFAWHLARTSPRWRSLMICALMVPFFTNFVIRVYATRTLLGQDGPLSLVMVWLGVLATPQSFNNSTGAVWFGMITNYLPFMVLPLIVAFEKLDIHILEAARDLGARPFQVVMRVLVPLTNRGIVAGSLLVFLPALGEFVIPDLLGGAKVVLLGNLITEQFLKVRHWPFGAALATTLLLMMVLSGFLLRFVMRGKTA